MESISHGIDKWTQELAGMTVRQVFEKYGDVFNLTRGAAVEVNGTRVGHEYVIQSGDAMEVVKETGQKG